MDTLASITTIVGAAVGLATLANTAWQYRRKVQLEIFRTYADRYNAIIPPEIYAKWDAAIKGEQQYWTDLEPTMIKYLNLILEETFLLKEGVINRRLWRLWLPDICRVVSSDFANTVGKANTFDFLRDVFDECKRRMNKSRNGG
jgi:hypothetical protein